MTLIYIGMNTEEIELDFKRFLSSRARDINNERVEVLRCADTNKEAIVLLDQIMATEAPVTSNIFELRSYHEHMKTFSLKPEVEHGAYRQFIKRDKRKNFKVNK